MLSKIFNFLDHSYARNVSFAFLMGILCVAFSGGSTALFVASSIFLIFINPKVSIKQVWRSSLSLAKKIPMVLVFPLFYLIVVVTSIRGENWLNEVFVVAGSYWQFLFIVPASVGLFHLSKDVNFAGLFSYGCRFGLMFVVPIALVQIFFFNIRPEGIFSNTLIFASLCVTGAGVAMIEWPEDTQENRIRSRLAFGLGITAALLTLSRGMLIPIGVIVAIALFYRLFVRSKYQMNFKTISIVGATVICVVMISLYSNIGGRIIDQRIIQPIEQYTQGKPFGRSLSQRIDMQLSGFHAFKQRPLVGHGIQNTVAQANAVSEETLGKKTSYKFSHLHNDYLTHAVGGGVLLLLLFVLVILSPIIMCWQWRRNKNEAGLFYFGLIITGTYSTIAITNIVFHNDQLTTMFCVATMFIIVRHIQLLEGIEEVRIPHLPTIANGINPIGLKPATEL